MNEEDEINNHLLNECSVENNNYFLLIDNISFYDKKFVVDNYNNDLICQICFNILNNPIKCSSKNNSHSFCKECIDKYLEKYNCCPICKNKFEYKISNENIKKLNTLNFKCIFQNEGRGYHALIMWLITHVSRD